MDSVNYENNRSPLEAMETRTRMNAFKIQFQSGEILNDEKTMEQLKKINQLKNIKSAVRQEMDWFSDVYEIPASIEKYPPQQFIAKFQSLLYHTPYDMEVPGYAMLPGELSKLCCERWLSSDHVYWFSEQINASQKDILCVYINHVSDVERFACNILSAPGGIPSSLLFIVNIGKDDRNVYMGSDSQPGVHWTIFLVDRDGKCLYGDSLGWKMPYDLIDKVKLFVRCIWSSNVEDYTVRYCHDPSGTSINSDHVCKSGCSTLYPLQTDSSICGVVSLLMAGVASTNKPLFNSLTRNLESDDSDKDSALSFAHITNPTKFSDYLRRVLIAWFMDGTFDCRYLLPVSTKDAQTATDNKNGDELRINNYNILTTWILLITSLGTCTYNVFQNKTKSFFPLFVPSFIFPR